MSTELRLVVCAKALKRSEFPDTAMAPQHRKAIVAALLFGVLGKLAAASQFDIAGPAGSSKFGSSVVVLPNHNIVVMDPTVQSGANTGAVYLYSPAGLLISTLSGSGGVGSGGIVVLPSSNFLVLSPGWNNTRGAVTWVDGSLGLNGLVSEQNSLVGESTQVRVGARGVAVLANGNYVVSSGYADNRVTWGSGSVGVSGQVSAANSFFGSGGMKVVPLPGGNYVLADPTWNNGAVNFVGAVTWANGATGIAGSATMQNSLCGTHKNDLVGENVVVLANGNYAVGSSSWDYDAGVGIDAGAVTWADGTKGIAGAVSSANSLTGINDGDDVGGEIVPLPNGNYVVVSPYWNDGAAKGVGAVTWVNGAQATHDTVSALNSLIGSQDADGVGSGGVVVLSNQNYVVLTKLVATAPLRPCSATWGSATAGIAGAKGPNNSLSSSMNSGPSGSCSITALTGGNYVFADNYWGGGRGAAMLVDGGQGIGGVLSDQNSIVGSPSREDRVSSGGVYALDDGNFVVCSPNWGGSQSKFGAATWGNGAGGTVGEATSSNSLLGTSPSDSVCSAGVVALTNGRYLVRSPLWDGIATTNAGALTFAPGGVAFSDPISPLNSLIGAVANEQVGGGNVTALSFGGYVVSNPLWTNGSAAAAGSVTWSSPLGVAGTVTPQNSLIGTQINDRVGTTVVKLPNDRYLIKSPSWHDSNGTSVGAITLVYGATQGPIGAVPFGSSVVGAVSGEGNSMVYVYDTGRDRLIVGRPASNLVSILDSDEIFASSFE